MKLLKKLIHLNCIKFRKYRLANKEKIKTIQSYHLEIIISNIFMYILSVFLIDFVFRVAVFTPQDHIL